MSNGDRAAPTSYHLMKILEHHLDSLRAHIKNNEGLLLIIASEAFFASMNVAVKFLGTDVSVLQIVWIRMTITYICSIAYMFYADIPSPILGPPGIRILLCFRGLAGFFGIFGLYFSLQYLSLSDAIVLTFLTPLCSAIVGWVFLKEKVEVREVVAGVVSLVGVVLIARPPFLFLSAVPGHGLNSELRRAVEKGVTTAQRMVAVGVALSGVAGVTCECESGLSAEWRISDEVADNLIRVIGKRAHPLHNIVYLSAFCVVSSSIG